MSSTMSKSDRGPLLGALLRIASQASSERIARWLESTEFSDIQPAHSAVIQPLWDQPEGARITSLARSGRMTKQSMSALVDHLERTGYVERVDDPDDARATRVRLTTRGKAYARAIRAFGREVEAEWAARIGAKRIDELKHTLELLRVEIFEASD
jgi:DNA-binding MarR family transcriptional regulator